MSNTESVCFGGLVELHFAGDLFDLGLVGVVLAVVVDQEPGVQHDLIQRHALVGVFFQDAGEEMTQIVREPLGELDLAKDDLAENGAVVVAVEGQVARHHSEQNHATVPGVDLVTLVAVLCLDDDLRGHVLGGAALGVEEVVCVVDGLLHSAHAEIGDLDVVVGGNEEVFGLEISVVDAFAVAVEHGVDEVLKILPRALLVQALPLDDLVVELTAFHELHDDVHVVAAHEDLFDGDDVGVAEVLHDFDLLADLALELVHGHAAAIKDFDGISLARGGMDAKLHVGEGPRAQGLFQNVVSDFHYSARMEEIEGACDAQVGGEESVMCGGWAEGPRGRIAGDWAEGLGECGGGADWKGSGQGRGVRSLGG
mmetsp:Transcript_22249/g.55038  ORF Transcript_22249/g.55038 Transcript_22249/m.55038 type:complete len:368 (-) Transcript_22249:68-1171(-)